MEQATKSIQDSVKGNLLSLKPLFLMIKYNI